MLKLNYSKFYLANLNEFFAFILLLLKFENFYIRSPESRLTETNK